MPKTLTHIPDAVTHILNHSDGDIHLATPLGLGKPYHLLNGIYDAIEADGKRRLNIYTALSLNPPTGKSELENRFLTPFVNRLYGKDFPRLKYADANAKDALPDNIKVEEFYMQSGALLGSRTAQSEYASLNYSHVPEALAVRDINVIVQKIASDGAGKYSLSCNTDLTMDTLDAIARLGKPRPLFVGVVDSQLPFVSGEAEIDLSKFDLLVEPTASNHDDQHDEQLFALPRQPVGDVDYAIGLYASTLVKDGGTLQIGIGALADAFCHALVLRHTNNECYRQLINALDPSLVEHPTVQEFGGLEPFEVGLYGCSEMLNEGFRVLVEQGVIKRRVVDDADIMARVATGHARDADNAYISENGQFLHGAFYLGSPDFYAWLRQLAPTRNTVGMKRISEVNTVAGEHYALEVHKRQHARFFNTCMMATVLGGASSETLPDGRVVSGVGGQYNFVSMGHTLPDAKSVLMLRASRQGSDGKSGNIKTGIENMTIPRHLRDVYITEYGIADLRYRSDGECIRDMIQIADKEFQQAVLDEAIANRKLSEADMAPLPNRIINSHNTTEALSQKLANYRTDGTLPDYPLGSDFTDTEQDIVRALSWLQNHTASTSRKLATVSQAMRQNLSGMVNGFIRGASDKTSVNNDPSALTAEQEQRLADAMTRMGFDIKQGLTWDSLSIDGIKGEISEDLLELALQATLD